MCKAYSYYVTFGHLDDLFSCLVFHVVSPQLIAWWWKEKPTLLRTGECETTKSSIHYLLSTTILLCIFKSLFKVKFKDFVILKFHLLLCIVDVVE